MDSLLPIEAITPELLNAVARTFFDEDRKGVMPDWWPVAQKAANDAMKQDFNEGVLDMMKSAQVQIEMHGDSPSVVSGLILKAICVGWRMAELYLSEQLEKTAN